MFCIWVVFTFATKVPHTDSVRCVLSCQAHSDPGLVAKSGDSTSSVLHPHRHHRHHAAVADACLQRNRTLPPLTYWCWVYTAVVSVRPVPLFPGPIWRQDPWRVSQHNISRVSFLGVVACLPQVSFFLFPLATISLPILIFFRVRGGKRSRARDRSGILKVGLHHDVPAVLDHGQGEQDHAPPHHAAQEV